MIEVFTDLARRADEFEAYANPHNLRIAAIEIRSPSRSVSAARPVCCLAAMAHDLGEVVMNRDYIHRRGTLSDDERIDLSVIRFLANVKLPRRAEIRRAGAGALASRVVEWQRLSGRFAFERSTRRSHFTYGRCICLTDRRVLSARHAGNTRAHI
jgi:hypothetical protein